MKITIETDHLLDLLYCLGANPTKLSASDIIFLDETTPFSAEFILKVVREEPAHTKTQKSIADLESSAGRPMHEFSAETWKDLLQ